MKKTKLKTKLKKFNVLVTREATESTEVDGVWAASAHEAEQLALKEATDSPGSFTWTVDEGNSGDAPYIPDPGNSAEEVTPATRGRN